MLQKGLILALLSIFTIFYQLNAQDDFSIGPRVGVNLSNVSNVDNSKTLAGLAIGLTSTYSINETSGLTLDLLYSKEGYTVDPNDVKFSYLRIPIYYDLFFGKLGEAIRPKIYVGFAPGFLLDAKVNDEVADKSQFSSVDFPFSGGFGVNVRVSNRIWLNSDLRGFLSLNDVRAKSYQAGDAKHNNNIQLSVGLAYGLTKWK